MSVLGFNIQYQTENNQRVELRELGFAFERAGTKLEKFGSFVWPAVIKALEKDAEQQFNDEGSGPHGPWAPLSPKYKAVKEIKYPGVHINIRSGALGDALTNSGAAHALRVETDTELVYGTQELPYAGFIQVGTSKMPARPPVDVHDDTIAAIKRAAANGIRQAILEEPIAGTFLKGDETWVP